MIRRRAPRQVRRLLTRVDALEAFDVAVREAIDGPRGAFAEVGTETRRTLPGVTVLATGKHVALRDSAASHLEFDGVHIVAVSDRTGCIVNEHGPCLWDELVETGRVVER